tara:strand:- start:15753 stop:16799 length:1047 start_codon:yes stop_codon:yes gene_type:complete
MLYVLVQIIFAIILIVLMGVLAYGIYNKNAQEMLLDMINPSSIKKSTKIIDGAYEYIGNTSTKFNTTDKTKGTYVDLSPSINQKGGAVYTYNFWLYFPTDATGVDEDKTLVLFNKGSNKLVKYTSSLRCNTTDNWFLVKNPLVRLDFNLAKKIEAIVVEFNSIETPDVFHEGANTGDKNCTSGGMVTKDANLIGIKDLETRTDLLEQWNMITIVVSETSPDDNVFVSSNQALVKLYLNGYAYLNKDGQLENKSTAMKTNNSDLHLGFSGNGNTSIYTGSGAVANESTKVAISDLTYFNYVLEDKEIIDLFKKGCNKATALIPNENEFENAIDKEATLELKAVNKPTPF